MQSTPVVFISIGRLTEKKGHQYLIAAFKKVLDSGLEARLIIVGEGDLKPQLLEQIYDLDLRDSVELLGRKTQLEIKLLLQSVHVFVLASVTASNGDTEGQGLVLQEAQAVGLPVIATNHNGFPDSLQDNHTGFLVPERDSDALAQKMCLLGFDPNLRHKMGQAGADFARENFSSEVILSLTEANILSRSVKS
ncbi:MAG: glycosyltransferase [Cyanobacteria bacterium J06636_16]